MEMDFLGLERVAHQRQPLQQQQSGRHPLPVLREGLLAVDQHQEETRPEDNDEGREVIGRQARTFAGTQERLAGQQDERHDRETPA